MVSQDFADFAEDVLDRDSVIEARQEERASLIGKSLIGCEGCKSAAGMPLAGPDAF
jgi:hypothetical protein